MFLLFQGLLCNWCFAKKHPLACSHGLYVETASTSYIDGKKHISLRSGGQQWPMLAGFACNSACPMLPVCASNSSGTMLAVYASNSVGLMLAGFAIVSVWSKASRFCQHQRHIFLNRPCPIGLRWYFPNNIKHNIRVTSSSNIWNHLSSFNIEIMSSIWWISKNHVIVKGVSQRHIPDPAAQIPPLDSGFDDAFYFVNVMHMDAGFQALFPTHLQNHGTVSLFENMFGTTKIPSHTAMPCVPEESVPN